jgi:hypothetical protein
MPDYRPGTKGSRFAQSTFLSFPTEKKNCPRGPGRRVAQHARWVAVLRKVNE